MLLAFNDLEATQASPLKGAALLALRRINGFLSINMTRNNSGALLLTMQRFTCATKARMTSGGRFHPESSWLAPVADGLLSRATGWAEAP